MSATPSIGTTTNAAATNTINSGLSSLADNYQTFLTLLTTQLKNQDPLSPLDTNQFTQQLTQMTGVQQQLLSNQLLQQLVNQGQSGGGLTGAVNLIGKTVTVDGSTATLSGGNATWEFNLPTAPASMTVSVVDSNGNIVWSQAVTPNGSGPQSFSWDGKNQSGTKLADGGTYTLKVAAKDSAGAAITATTSLQGSASAVQQINGQTMVTVGGVQVPLSSITGVTS
jgi:flagellar basal-body rod modification protein FlgD